MQKAKRFDSIVSDWKLKSAEIKRFDKGKKQGILKYEVLFTTGQSTETTIECTWDEESQEWTSLDGLLFDLEAKSRSFQKR